MEVHNITPELIASKPVFLKTNFYAKLEELNNKENYLIAHNMPFDLGMLEKEGFEPNIKLIDTLRCSKHLLPDSPYHRLQYFRYSLGLYKDEEKEAKKHNIEVKAHDAIGDVLVMKLLLSKLVQIIRENSPDINPMDKLVELTKTPVFIKTFRFGKYKGEDIIDVCKKDVGYINWMMNNMELGEDLEYTLKKLVSDKHF
jgi:DNA polymerase-3 subunit epsilon/exodeoxyribonuclease X